MDIYEILQTLITSITSIIIALITAGYFKKMQDKFKYNKHKTTLIKQIQKDELIHYSLKELTREYSCDRITITQFHNGGNFYTESPMQRASVSYERCSDGIERIYDKFQNILVSHYNWYITRLMTNNMFYVDNDLIEDLTTRAFLKNFGSQSHVSVPILDKQKNLIGYLSMDWVFSEIPSQFIEENQFTDVFKTRVRTQVQSLLNNL